MTITSFGSYLTNFTHIMWGFLALGIFIHCVCYEWAEVPKNLNRWWRFVVNVMESSISSTKLVSSVVNCFRIIFKDGLWGGINLIMPRLRKLLSYQTCKLNSMETYWSVHRTCGDTSLHVGPIFTTDIYVCFCVPLYCAFRSGFVL
jgi:hypothetical protein